MTTIQTIVKGTALVISAVALSSCMNLNMLRKQSFKPTNFDRELAREYKEFAESEADQYDWIDSDYFAKKGRKSLQDKRPVPEVPSKWREPADKLPELVQARQVLVQALTPANKASKPTNLAHAQVMYDCWVEQQEENWQPDDIAACRDKFLDAMASLNKRSTAPFNVVKHDTVYFAFDKSQLDAAANRVIQGVAIFVNRSGNYRVSLGGHTDKSGSNAYNDALAKRRTDSVKQALVSDRVPAAKIMKDAFGENRPKVPTADGVKEGSNRRVEIYVIE